MAFQPKEMTQDTLRRVVDNLVRHLKTNPLPQNPKRSQLQEAVASALGFSSYHDAVQQIKNNQHKKPEHPPSATYDLLSDWIVPSEDMSSFSSWPHRSLHGEATSNMFAFKHEDFAHPVMVLAKEKTRKKAFSLFRDLNKDKPFYIIQGPMSLFPIAKDASVIKTQDMSVVLKKGSTSHIINHLISRLGASSPDASMWNQRAISMVSSLILALVHLRDFHNLELKEETIIENLDLENIVALSKDQKRLPPHILQSLKAYLRSIPSYNDQTSVQSEVVKEQHGYLKMQFTPMLEPLSEQKDKNLLFDESVSKTPSLVQCLLPDRKVKTDELATIQASMSKWSKSHPNGLILVDIPTQDESVWSLVLNGLPNWNETGHPVWIGLQSLEDMPHTFQQMILKRMDMVTMLNKEKN